MAEYGPETSTPPLRDLELILDASVPVRGVGRDHMAHPSKQSARSNPEAGRDDQPEDAAEEVAVVNLADSRNDHAENRGQAGVA